MRAVLSLGSNMGRSREILSRAVAAVAATAGIESVAVSPLYATAPWGGVEQEDFLNLTMVVETTLSPAELLAVCQEQETAAHRTREVRWGPRTLDIDIVDYESVRSEDPELLLPHPRAHLRAFVLLPWLAVDPAAVLGRRRVVDLVAELPAEDLAGVRYAGGVVPA